MFIEGRLQTRNWDAQDGTKKSKTEIVAERVRFGPKKTREEELLGKKDRQQYLARGTPNKKSNWKQ